MAADSPKPIRLSVHANGYLSVRGFTVEQVRDVIETATWKFLGDNRFEASKEFVYGATWNGFHYSYVRVRPIFSESDAEILVITVYTYYH